MSYIHMCHQPINKLHRVIMFLIFICFTFINLKFNFHTTPHRLFFLVLIYLCFHSKPFLVKLPIHTTEWIPRLYIHLKNLPTILLTDFLTILLILQNLLRYIYFVHHIYKTVTMLFSHQNPPLKITLLAFSIFPLKALLIARFLQSILEVACYLILR